MRGPDDRITADDRVDRLRIDIAGARLGPDPERQGQSQGPRLQGLADRGERARVHLPAAVQQARVVRGFREDAINRREAHLDTLVIGDPADDHVLAEHPEVMDRDIDFAQTFAHLGEVDHRALGRPFRDSRLKGTTFSESSRR